MTQRRKPDKLDLRLAEIEAKLVTGLRHLAAKELLEHCKISHPWCPLLNSTKICPNIQKALEEEVSDMLQEISERN